MMTFNVANLPRAANWKEQECSREKFHPLLQGWVGHNTQTFLGLEDRSMYTRTVCKSL
jgi:hypothetical protein